ncbi:hypothetical protein WJX72_008322 [[Myrmecia] bisecta]|uniref:Mitochondrial carrier protein n=1 Tax=[Myrmecia] bisecta TaxID=41462 RepID=A0AAW1PU81_9CHLO
MPTTVQASPQPQAGNEKPRQPLASSVVSGFLSGALVSVCVQPLDVVRTRMQGEAAAGLSRGPVATFRTILSESGPRGFWRGTSPTVLRLSLGLGLHFFALEHIKDLIIGRHADGDRRLSPWEAFVAGGLSRAVAAGALCPVTVIKTRMEYGGLSTTHYTSVANAFSTIVKQNGPSGLFRGVVPTMVTNAPFSALYYMFYSELKKRLQQEGRSTTAVNFASGTMAAIAATLLTQPTDVIRTRMQLGLAGGAQLSSLQTLKGLLAASGPRALLVGTMPRVVKRTLQTALVWTLYEELAPRLTKLGAHVKETALQHRSKS